MLTDMLGLGRTAFTAVNEGAYILPEVEEITLESVEDIDGDPFEFMVSAVYENELNFERIEKAMILDEYAYLLENGQEMVFEAGKLKGYFEKARTAILNVLKNITKFFKAVFAKLTDVVRNNEKWSKKYQTVLSEKKLYGVTVNLEKEVTSYESDSVITEKAKKYIDTAESCALKTQNNIDAEKTFNILTDITGEKDESFDKLYQRKFTKKVKSISVTESDMKELENSKAAVKDFKQIYEYTRAGINGILKQLKVLEKTADKKEDTSDVARAVAYVKAIASALQTIDKLTVQYTNKRYAFIKKCVSSVIADSNKKDKKGKESVNASASFIESVELL